MNALSVLTDAGLHLHADGDRLIVAPASRLTDPLRALIRQHKRELLETARAAHKGGNPLMSPEQGNVCHAGGWDDGEIAAFTTRVVKFMRAGISVSAADDLAERLTLRNREGDDRRACAECRHCRSGRCGNHERAGLCTPDVGRDLAVMLQRCPGFTPVEATR